jgi:hypothetical protein
MIDGNTPERNANRQPRAAKNFVGIAVGNHVCVGAPYRQRRLSLMIDFTQLKVIRLGRLSLDACTNLLAILLLLTAAVGAVSR